MGGVSECKCLFLNIIIIIILFFIFKKEGCCSVVPVFLRKGVRIYLMWFGLAAANLHMPPDLISIFPHHTPKKLEQRNKCENTGLNRVLLYKLT